MQPDHSNVVVFPPLVPVSSFALGVLLDRLVPLGAIPVELRWLGACVFAVGIAGFVWMIVTMKRARTPIHNARTPTALVETGPFRLTRNPMYLFGTVWYVGVVVMLGEPWPLITIVPAMIVLHHGVVLREEAYLERRFGAAYTAYCARVRRWL